MENPSIWKKEKCFVPNYDCLKNLTVGKNQTSSCHQCYNSRDKKSFVKVFTTFFIKPWKLKESYYHQTDVNFFENINNENEDGSEFFFFLRKYGKKNERRKTEWPELHRGNGK